MKNWFLKMIKKTIRGFYYFKKRFLLRNKNFSIICNNCIGGCIYHNLKKEFLSPTINMYIKTDDFLKMLVNLKYYVNANLEEASDKLGFPVGKIDDVMVFFNHSDNFDTAKVEWEKRRERINWNNIYVIIREIDFDSPISPEKINFLLSLYKNLVIITFNPKRKNLPHYQFIDAKNNNEFAKNSFGIDLWDRKWNWIKFINKKQK